MISNSSDDQQYYINNTDYIQIVMLLEDFLLQNDLSIEYTDDEKVTPLLYLVSNDKYHSMKILIANPKRVITCYEIALREIVARANNILPTTSPKLKFNPSTPENKDTDNQTEELNKIIDWNF